MMQRIHVHISSSNTSYPIIIGDGASGEVVRFLQQAPSLSRVAIIADTGVPKAMCARVLSHAVKNSKAGELFLFPKGEEHKTQQTVTKLQHQLLAKKYGRDTLIVALGGGVVGDLAGFVAATYMRGVPFVQIPTTLLAMVDASIGGKTGINTPYGKNTIGAFHQPRAVFMDIGFLGSLPPRQVRNGLFEAVKTFYTSDAAALALAHAIDIDAPLSTPRPLIDTIHRSVAIKAGIVERDEKESNERRVINFGHTIGHALELLSKYRLPHGYAVGYGMLAEVGIAKELGVLSQKECDEVIASLGAFEIHASFFTSFSASAIVEATYGDKKVKKGKPQYVLLKKIGSVYTKNRQFAHPVSDAVVNKVLIRLGCKK